LLKQFSTNALRPILASSNVPPLKAPAGMSATALPLAVLVQLICENGIESAPLVRLAGVLSCSVALAAPVVALGGRYEPPT